MVEYLLAKDKALVSFPSIEKEHNLLQDKSARKITHIANICDSLLI